MKALNILKDRAYNNAVAHGWHEEDLSNEHFLCLVISELMEAVEADRKGQRAEKDKFYREFEFVVTAQRLSGYDYDRTFVVMFDRYIKDTIEDELADACIRIFDLAGLRNCNLSYIDSLIYLGKVTFTEFCYLFCSFISNPDKSSKDWLERHLNYSLGWIFSFCKRNNINILWHIEQKIKYNELRPYKHYGKKY